MKRIITLILILLSVLLVQNACRKSVKGLYDFSNITKAEVADFKSDNYKLIDHIEFIKIIRKSKLNLSKFLYYKTVILYDDDGKSYSLYFSKCNKGFSIDGKTFGLSEKQSKKITKILK